MRDQSVNSGLNQTGRRDKPPGFLPNTSGNNFFIHFISFISFLLFFSPLTVRLALSLREQQNATTTQHSWFCWRMLPAPATNHIWTPVARAKFYVSPNARSDVWFEYLIIDYYLIAWIKAQSKWWLFTSNVVECLIPQLQHRKSTHFWNTPQQSTSNWIRTCHE